MTLEIINFGKETRDAIHHCEYALDDIAWIGSRAVEIPIDQFFKVADNTDYYAGYGTAEMPMDLLIVMKDGSYFERAEYDGSEWWRYIPCVKRPQLKSTLKVKSFYPPKDYDPRISWYTHAGRDLSALS